MTTPTHKVCGKRGSAYVYTRPELVNLAVQNLAMKKTAALRMKREDLCRLLGIQWVEKNVAPVHTPKVCSSRKTRAYPNRYTRDELITLIRRRHPYMVRARLLRSSMKTLCRLASMPFTEVVKRRDDDEPRPPVKQVYRYYKSDEKTPPGPVAPCMTRGVKPPFQYQKRVVEHFRRHRGLIAVHSVGSGKTLTALLASQCYLDEHPNNKVVVISPTSLIDNFKKEMSQFGELHHKSQYEFFSFQGFYNKYKDQSRRCRDHMLIVDEAHNLRTEHRKSSKGPQKDKGKMNRVITKCAEGAQRILLLTATPLINKCTDIAPLLNMVRDNPDPNNKVTVKQLKQNMDDDDFMRRVAICKFSFYERQKACDDYPRTEEEDIFLVMPPRFATMYNKVEGELMEEDVLRTFGESRLKPFYNGVRRAVNILSELPEEEMLKSPKIKWIIKELRDNPKKTVIFSHFLESGLESIQNRLPAGLRSAFITGKQSKQARTDIVNRYNRDEIDVLFLSKAGGEGIDLKGTRRIILLESGWNENSEKQVIGRGVRFRSHANLPHAEQNVTIYRLYHVKPTEKDSIDEILSPEHEVRFNEPGTWPSADLLLKRISQDKARSTNHCMEILKKYSIERNPDC